MSKNMVVQFFKKTIVRYSLFLHLKADFRVGYATVDHRLNDLMFEMKTIRLNNFSTHLIIFSLKSVQNEQVPI